MKNFMLVGLLGGFFARAVMAQSNIVNEASQLELRGRFKEAAALLQSSIEAKKDSAAELKLLAFELDRLKRIREDFSVTREELYGQFKSSLKGLTPAEFDGWVKQGWLDGREIDGKMFFFSSALNNLYFRHPELNARLIEPMDEKWHEKKVLDIVTAIKKAADNEKTPYVLPKTFRVTMDVNANAGAAPAGETIRAWVPIPRRYPFQYDIKLLSSSVKAKSIDSEDSPARSIYFEQTAKARKDTDFQIEYEYTVRGVHFDLQPEKIQPYNPNDEAVKQFTAEKEHVVFTPEIKALSTRIVRNETNPMLKAKRIYDYLSNQLQYSYSLEYSTIRNISDSCRSNCYGDCGQQALLFITLCRYNGVPARWQSGWNLFPKYTSNHDWAEIYLAPYGWVPVDQYMGNYAMRYITTLTLEQRVEIRDFYFGGLDQYRMVANSDHNHALNPPKDSMRSDDVDFQRGELEHNGQNIYLDQFSYSLKYKEIPTPTLP